MYYNIKIKADGSQYCLESTDKDITQREMDLYFAIIFGASEEFVASIKSTVKKRQSETMAQNSIPENTKKEDTSNEIQAENIIQENEDEFSFDSIEENATSLEENETFEEINQVTGTASSPDNNNEAADDISLEELSSLSKLSEAQEENNFNDIFGKINRKELYSDSNNSTFSTINSDTHISSEKLSEIFNYNSAFNTQNFNQPPKENHLEFDFDFVNQEDDFLKELRKIDNQFKEKVSQINKTISTNFNINPITEGTLPQTPTVTPMTDYDFSTINKRACENLPTVAEIEAKLGKQDIKKAEIIENIHIDFKDFLKNYDCKNIYDDFIACAYYTNYILKEESFSIKSINAKLFCAKEKIANMSVVDTLVKSKCLAVYPYEDGNLYALTPEGERYFVNKLKN